MDCEQIERMLCEDRQQFVEDLRRVEAERVLTVNGPAMASRSAPRIASTRRGFAE
jgi:hypothetical protein